MTQLRAIPFERTGLEVIFLAYCCGRCGAIEAKHSFKIQIWVDLAGEELWPSSAL